MGAQRLTLQEEARIRRLRKEGHTLREIARIVGRSWSGIRLVELRPASPVPEPVATAVTSWTTDPDTAARIRSARLAPTRRCSTRSANRRTVGCCSPASTPATRGPATPTAHTPAAFAPVNS